jgi:hypothetical protein
MLNERNNEMKYTFERCKSEVDMAASAIQEELGRARYYYTRGEFEMTDKQLQALTNLMIAADAAVKEFSK